MKTSLFFFFSILFVSSVITGCHKPKLESPTSRCSSADSTTYVKSLNIFDFTPGSFHYNQVIANFQFVQTETTCPSEGSVTHLIIQNNTQNTISFDYNINFSLNLARWNYQGIATIAPFSSLDAGDVSSNPARTDMATITIQCANVMYR